MYPSVKNVEQFTTATVVTPQEVDPKNAKEKNPSAIANAQKSRLLIRIKVVHLASWFSGFDFENFGTHMVEIKHKNNLNGFKKYDGNIKIMRGTHEVVFICPFMIKYSF